MHSLSDNIRNLPLRKAIFKLTADKMSIWGYSNGMVDIVERLRLICWNVGFFMLFLAILGIFCLEKPLRCQPIHAIPIILSSTWKQCWTYGTGKCGFRQKICYEERLFFWLRVKEQNAVWLREKLMVGIYLREKFATKKISSFRAETTAEQTNYGFC